MPARRRALAALSGLLPLGAAPAVVAQGAASAASEAAGSAGGIESRPAFAVEIRTGPAWDAAKPAQAQLLFREHSAHLRRLREEGHILVGARYGDKGLLLVSAADAAAARALFDADPSMKAGTFVFEVHALAVFYGGCVQPPSRRG